MSSATELFTKLMKELYTFGFFQKTHCERLEAFSKSSEYTEQCEKTFVISSSRTILEKVELYKHIMIRSPIYFGEHKKSLFNESKLEEIFGYSLEEVDKVDNVKPYAICGPIHFLTQSKVELDVAVLHTWGVNFEKKNTKDYQTLVDTSTGIIKVEKYRERIYEMFRLIVNGSLNSYSQSKAKESGGQLVIRCPLIGTGAFLTALHPEYKKVAFQLFADGLRNIVIPLLEGNIFKLMIFEKTHPLIPFISDLIEGGNPSFQVCIGPKDGNLMDVFTTEIPENHIVVVNAWDNKAFIGNGGFIDRTIDGFIVADAGGFNSHFRNTSYFHNPFFFSSSIRIIEYKEDIVPLKISSDFDISKIVLTSEKWSLKDYQIEALSHFKETSSSEMIAVKGDNMFYIDTKGTLFQFYVLV